MAILAANITYTLTVAIGDPLYLGVNGATRIALLANGVLVASAQLLPTDYPPTATGTFVDLVASFTTLPTGDPRIGQAVVPGCA